MNRIAIALAVLFAASSAYAQAPAMKPATPGAPTKIVKMDTSRVDINVATPEQLMAVKGLTPALADAIIKGRPFKSVDELKTTILPAEVFAAVKDSLTVTR